MDELGLSPRSLLAANPRLVYVALTGFGLDGPYADRPALDIIVQGLSGLMSVTGEEGGAPVKVGVSIADLTAALYATVATLAALRARDRDGAGQPARLAARPPPPGPSRPPAISARAFLPPPCHIRCSARCAASARRSASSARRCGTVAPAHASASTMPTSFVSSAAPTPTSPASSATVGSPAHDGRDPARTPRRRALDHCGPPHRAQRHDVRHVRAHRGDLPGRERGRVGPGGASHRRRWAVRRGAGYSALR